ncbi:MAG: UDP-N-acetylmuramoyl-L-alanine--D-glutamate ligase [Cyanosarcina radialis HA8281-LM2]|jgi:UDP-N-acetylmuramoylalanine--D-glutamate ligase|nr:UDP-N-acetylmuramoyl-L-alanine--D-glutamate ligase [Cyanosarcina radialis HA8281-LM2]
MAHARVIGLGKSGIVAAKLLQREGWDVIISDRQSSESLQQQQQELAREGIAVELDRAFVPTPSVQLIVVSPGVRWDLPALVDARNMGIETIGEMELAWRYLQSCPWVAITGTNGKTTTTALIAAIFQAAGFHAPACGNIGYAACELALAEKPPDWVIAEISSYQIESSTSLAPQIGVWTTFTPDHLSRHYTLDNYYQIKAKLLERSRSQIFNGDDAYLHQMGKENWQNACWTSIRGQEHLLGNPDLGAYIENGWVVMQGEPILPATTLKMPGEHNQQNLLMAVATARLAGIDKEAIFQGIDRFPGVPHRLERICTLAGIEFINDSKATNYDAAQVGLSSVDSPAILIAGGEAKEGDDTGWLQTIRAKAAAVLLIGKAASAFAQRLQEVGYDNYEIVETMENAVSRGTVLAQQYNARVVLLSPACASFDQYENFEQRGEHFRQLCQQLLPALTPP